MLRNDVRIFKCFGWFNFFFDLRSCSNCFYYSLSFFQRISYWIFECLDFLGFHLCLYSRWIGGWIIELILRKSYNKGILTAKRATKTGIALAGLAGIATSGVGILVIMFMPHAYWMVVVDEIQHGYFFAHFYDYLLTFLYAIARYSLEILLVIAIACLSGGLTGWILAKQILNPKIITLFNGRE